MNRSCTYIKILFIALVSFNVWAAKYYTFMYKVKDGDDFGSILKQFVKPTSVINARTPMIRKTISKNPKVKDWGNLQPGELLELYIAENFMDLSKFKNFDKDNLARIEEDEKLKRNPNYTVGLKGSVYYMSSLGVFNQKNSDVGDVKFNQNAPFSAGISFSYYPRNKLYSFSFGGYFSYLWASVNNLTNEKVEIPPELGANLYGEYRLIDYNTTLYSGLDFERFSTFNMEGLKQAETIYVDNNTVLYATLGMAKAVDVFDRQLFIKTSLSKSIVTGYSNSSPYPITGKNSYDGYKFLFYVNYKLNDKLYINSLVKYHWMSGPSQLTTFRFGAGVGYIIF